MSSLAIIIPAYKAEYIDQTLESLSLQTDKNFKVYIGDDCSPYDIRSTILQYQNKLDIVYKRFETNLGGKDLVGQWNRCLDMINDEEWFIMFSDDDIMEKKCIESFFNAVKTTNYDVYHFNLKVIDANSNITTIPNPYPQNLISLSFYNMLYCGKIDAKMPEFVFRTSHFKSTGGFVPFDLAIRTDNATVMVNAYDKKIYTIEGEYVQWRLSGTNLSSPIKNKSIVRSKFVATVSFFDWVTNFCYEKQEQDPLPPYVKCEELIERFLSASRMLGIIESYSILNQSLFFRRNKIRILIFFPYLFVKKTIIYFLKKR